MGNNTQSVKLLRYPDAVYNPASGMYTITLDEPGAEPLCTPAMRAVPVYRKDAEIICNDAIFMYKCADGLGELEASMPYDKYFAGRIFSLIAFHADVREISIYLDGAQGFLLARARSTDVDIKAFWMSGQPELCICGGYELLADKQATEAANSAPRRIIPSDLLYSLSIISQQMAIGSNGFLIRWDYANDEPETKHGQVVVAFNDVDMPKTYFGTRFPIGGKTAV